MVNGNGKRAEIQKLQFVEHCRRKGIAMLCYSNVIDLYVKRINNADPRNGFLISTPAKSFIEKHGFVRKDTATNHLSIEATESIWKKQLKRMLLWITFAAICGAARSPQFLMIVVGFVWSSVWVFSLSYGWGPVCSLLQCRPFVFAGSAQFVALVNALHAPILEGWKIVVEPLLLFNLRPPFIYAADLVKFVQTFAYWPIRAVMGFGVDWWNLCGGSSYVWIGAADEGNGHRCN